MPTYKTNYKFKEIGKFIVILQSFLLFSTLHQGYSFGGGEIMHLNLLPGLLDCHDAVARQPAP